MWEKIYWGFGAAGLSLLIVPRVRQYFRKDDSEVGCWQAVLRLDQPMLEGQGGLFWCAQAYV